MGGIATAVSSLAGAAGGAAGGLGGIGSIVGTVLSSALAPSPPSPAAPPPPPQVAPAPEAPKPADVQSVDGKEPVLDAEAARTRAQKRRRAAEDRRLFQLSSDADDSVSITKSLLGE